MARITTNANHATATQKTHPSRFLTTSSAETWSGSSVDRPSSTWTSPSAISVISVARLPLPPPPKSESSFGPSQGRSGDGAGMANPRIEHGVEHVDGEVDEHVADGDDDHGSLYGDVVTADDAVDRVLAEAVQGEDDLDDERAADEPTEVQADDGDEREGRRPEGVAQEDPARRAGPSPWPS